MAARHLLLVDDDPSLAAILRILARRAGHSLAWAPDAGAASLELARQRPSLVLLDVNLPGVSGIDWLRSLRPENPSLPVALFVQSGLSSDLARGMAAGADFHFAKELVADPAAWASRLGEILALVDGRIGPGLLTSPAPSNIEFGIAADRLDMLRIPDAGEEAPLDPKAAAMKLAHAILLVEDNPADVKITQRAIKESELGVELIVMRDGQEAIEYLLRQGAHADASNWRIPDLVLLDINLPRLDGTQVLERMRAVPLYRFVPVIAFTTSRRQEDIARMHAAGATTYIEKPSEFPRFVEVLRTIHRYWLATALLPRPADASA